MWGMLFLCLVCPNKEELCVCVCGDDVNALPDRAAQCGRWYLEDVYGVRRLRENHRSRPFDQESVSRILLPYPVVPGLNFQTQTQETRIIST